MQRAHHRGLCSSAARHLVSVAVAFACALSTGLTASALEPTPDTVVPATSEAAELAGRWQHLEAVTEGFRGLLPRDETWEETGLRETIAGTVAEKKYFGRSDGRTFSIGLHDLPDLGRFFAPTWLVLKTAKKNVLRTDAGREISYERRRFGDYPGALLTFAPTRESDDWRLMEVQLVLVGQRLYVLKASDPGDGADRVDADRFFESFEVID